MGEWKNILVAYDGSESAKNAIAAGASLAKKDGCLLKVLTVVPPYEGDLELVGVSNIKDAIEGPGEKLLSEARALTDKHGVPVRISLEQGEPFDRIVHVAHAENCDLIIMGRSGLSHLERELLGGVTARVIGHTGKQVLVVPENTTFNLDNILVATDGSADSEAAVNHALILAEENKSRLTALSVVHTNDEMTAMAPEYIEKMVKEADVFLKRIKDDAAKRGIQAETVIKEGNPHEKIVNLASEAGCSVIIMGTHGRKGLNRVLMGSVTERTIGYAVCPVLVIH